MKKLKLPLTSEQIKEIKAGDVVYLTGEVYTARDCAHKRIFELLDEGRDLPFEIDGATFFYAGPCPAKEGMACGSCGPTTSSRMQSFAPRLVDLGLKCIIGKGEMDEGTYAALKRNCACYFAAIGGAGALYGSKVKKSELVAFPELLSEAVYRFYIEDFPVVVAADCKGNCVFAAKK